MYSLAEYERLDTSCLELVGMLALAYSPPRDSELGHTRPVISSWFVLALLITTAYSCGLISHLTAPRNNPPLDSVKDLVKAGLHWGHKYLPTADIIFDKNVNIFIITLTFLFVSNCFYSKLKNKKFCLAVSCWKLRKRLNYFNFCVRHLFFCHGLLILEVSILHTTRHHSRLDSSGRVISSSQRPLPDNTQHSQQTNIRAPGGIRTHDLSRRAAADLRLRPRGHWDRQ